MIFELVHQKRTQASQLRHCRRKILRNMYALGPERGGCALLATVLLVSLSLCLELLRRGSSSSNGGVVA